MKVPTQDKNVSKNLTRFMHWHEKFTKVFS